MIDKIPRYIGQVIISTIVSATPLLIPLSLYMGWPDDITWIFGILYILDSMFINYLLWGKGNSS